MAYNLTTSGLTLGSDVFTNAKDVGLAAYPVGAIYMSLVSTSPATLFGGTWEALDEGRVLIGANSTYPVNSTGGEFEHTLTVEEMPSHTHNYKYYNSGYRGTLLGGGSGEYIHSGSRTTLNSGSTGGSQPHNNMQPYLAVYMWKRTG